MIPRCLRLVLRRVLRLSPYFLSPLPAPTAYFLLPTSYFRLPSDFRPTSTPLSYHIVIDLLP